MADEAEEWAEIFDSWPDSSLEARRRLETTKGLPDIEVSLVNFEERSLRSLLWKHLLFHPSSFFFPLLPFKPDHTPNDRSIFYESLLKKPADSVSKSAIEKDLDRSAPGDYIDYLTPEKIQQLRRVLLAYSVFDADLGYCQGLNFVAFMLLIHLNEEDAFWGLVLLLKGLSLRNIYDNKSDMLQTFLDMLECELKTRFPRLYLHLETEGISTAMYAMEWLTTFFVYSFPLHTNQRVWDIFLSRGYEGASGAIFWLYQVSLAILEICHDQLLQWHLDIIMTQFKAIVQEIEPGYLLQKAVDFLPTNQMKKKLKVFSPKKHCSIM